MPVIVFLVAMLRMQHINEALNASSEGNSVLSIMITRVYKQKSFSNIIPPPPVLLLCSKIPHSIQSRSPGCYLESWAKSMTLFSVVFGLCELISNSHRIYGLGL